MHSRTRDVYFQESWNLFQTAFQAVDGAYEDIANAGAKMKKAMKTTATTTSKTATTSKMATNKTARAKSVQAKAAAENTRLEAMSTCEATAIPDSGAKATTEATAIPDSGAKATTEATAIPDSGAKATTEATAIPDSGAKATTEASAIPYSEAKAVAEVEAQAIAEVEAQAITEADATAISEAKVWFWIPKARETEAVLPKTGKPKARLLGDGETDAATLPPLLFNVLVCSSKPRPQDSTQDIDIPSFETRFDETPDASVEETSTLAPATEESKVVLLDVSVEGPDTLVPTVGGAEARKFDAGQLFPDHLMPNHLKPDILGANTSFKQDTLGAIKTSSLR